MVNEQRLGIYNKRQQFCRYAFYLHIVEFSLNDDFNPNVGDYISNDQDIGNSTSMKRAGPAAFP